MTIVKRNVEILVAAGILLLAMLAFAWADGGFRFFGPLRRIITPNSDAYNPAAVFCFDNPAGSAVEGKIFSLLGSQVADFGSQATSAGPGAAGCPLGIFSQTYSLSWDGKANGSVVHSGVYIYQVRAEGANFTGTLLVVR